MKKLKGLSGNELFALKRHTLEEYCGVEEGKRLASQITIQRNVSGVSNYMFKTLDFHYFFHSTKLHDQRNY